MAVAKRVAKSGDLLLAAAKKKQNSAATGNKQSFGRNYCNSPCPYYKKIHSIFTVVKKHAMCGMWNQSNHLSVAYYLPRRARARSKARYSNGTVEKSKIIVVCPTSQQLFLKPSYNRRLPLCGFPFLLPIGRVPYSSTP